jgi:hypothetical protein
MDWQEAAHLMEDVINGGLSEDRAVAYDQIQTTTKLRRDYRNLLRTIGHLGCQYNERMRELFMYGPGAALYVRKEVKQIEFVSSYLTGRGRHGCQTSRLPRLYD